MTDPLLHTWSLNLGYVQRLVADIPDDQMAVQPAPGMNHAAWVLGHLACTADMLGSMLGLEPVCPADWPTLFDWNSSPSSDSSRYPTKATLLKALVRIGRPMALSQVSRPSAAAEQSAAATFSRQVADSPAS